MSDSFRLRVHACALRLHPVFCVLQCPTGHARALPSSVSLRLAKGRAWHERGRGSEAGVTVKQVSQ